MNRFSGMILIEVQKDSHEEGSFSLLRHCLNNSGDGMCRTINGDNLLFGGDLKGKEESIIAKREKVAVECHWVNEFLDSNDTE